MNQLNKSHVVKAMTEIGIEGEVVRTSHAEKYLDLALEGIIKTMESLRDEEPNDKGIRGRITMVGFGTFEVRAVKERVHHNPNDPSQKTVKPAHNSAKFKEGKTLSEFIN